MMSPVRMAARLAPTRRCDRAVGSTVNVAAASYTNSIGDVTQMAYWEDPDFDPKERAFYYVRVLEIPTPRWTTYDAAFFGLICPRVYRLNSRKGRTPRHLVHPVICGWSPGAN